MSKTIEEVLSSDDYFMTVAFLAALKSKDPNTKAGACIVNKHKEIVGIGKNRMPGRNGDSILPYNRGTATDEEYYNSKYPYVLHSETDAILNKTCKSLDGCTLYSVYCPTSESAKLIVESGIKEVYYYSDKKFSHVDTESSKSLLGLSEIPFGTFESKGLDPKLKRFFDDLSLSKENMEVEQTPTQ